MKKELLLFKDNSFLFPTEELLKSIPQEFKIGNDLIFLQKTYTISLIKTAIQNGKYKSIVVGMNGNRLIGFIAQNILKSSTAPATFTIKPLSAFHASSFENSILSSLKTFNIKWKEEDIISTIKYIKNKTPILKEMKALENGLIEITPNTNTKLKI